MREEFARLVEIVAMLRSPEGCPWDREQTIDSLKPYVLEETYEVVEAIDRGDHAALREELGDFVFEAVFLAQLESEAGHFTIADSLTAIADKLIRRHPHVFARQDGEAPVSSAGDVVTRWEQIKAQERGGAAKPKTLLGGVPAALPALLRAYQIGLRAKSVGFDWLRPADVVDKIQEEVDEVREAVADGSADEPATGRGRDGRPALYHRQPVPPARHRAGDRAAQGERQVHKTLRSRWSTRSSRRAERCAT